MQRPTPFPLTLFFAALTALALATIVPAATLYVAPDGNDSCSGTLARPNRDRNNGPLASLQGARDAVLCMLLNAKINFESACFWTTSAG